MRHAPATPPTATMMTTGAAAGPSIAVTLADEAATMRFAADVACALEPGDVVTLSGDLGAGKTAFARALIRHLADDAALEVPSPSFALMQSYELPRFPLVHADLYRLSGADELSELGLDDLPENAVVLIEWADRAAGAWPADRLDIEFTLVPSRGEARCARYTGYGAFAPRAARIGQVRDFLAQAGLGGAARRRLKGDASSRVFERLHRGQQSFVFMNAPARPDGPPVRHGKPYSAVARLAEDTLPYVAVAAALRERDISAPAILHADTDRGLIVMEDLGEELIVAGDPPAPIAARYEAALDLLAALHRRALPELLAAGYRLPRYDMEAFLIEAELMLDWYLPQAQAAATDSARTAFAALWRAALAPALQAPATLVLRDYHSPNLLWLADRAGTARVGVLDFQDAVSGPAAYDVASLLQDVRVDVPRALELKLLDRYVRARQAAEPGFAPAAFARLYATLAAQRATKVLGIFARLDARDGKPQYLRHIPRIFDYLERSLAHPDLAQLRAWYAANVPPPRSRPESRAEAGGHR